jgi:hypothetical protein
MANRKQPTWTYCGRLIDLPVTFANSGRKTRHSYRAAIWLDLGDSWEHADNPEYPQQCSALGIRIGVNYVVYSMTR